MNELKEQIELDGLLTIQRHKETVEIDLDRLMQLIETYTAKKELEARIDAIKSYKKVNKLLNETIVKDLLKCRDKDGFWVDKKLLKLINQLQSQLKEIK